MPLGEWVTAVLGAEGSGGGTCSVCFMLETGGFEGGGCLNCSACRPFGVGFGVGVGMGVDITESISELSVEIRRGLLP